MPVLNVRMAKTWTDNEADADAASPKSQSHVENKVVILRHDHLDNSSDPYSIKTRSSLIVPNDDYTLDASNLQANSAPVPSFSPTTDTRSRRLCG